MCCSMPTYTHTFFYRTVISDVTNNDIQRTTDYLAQIKENTNNKEQAQIKVRQLEYTKVSDTFVYFFTFFIMVQNYI